jgi:hypothetical protein
MNSMDEELRALMQRREPPRDLVAPVRARLAQNRPQPWWRGWMAGVALAAVVALAALGGYQWRQQDQKQAIERRDGQQVAQALGVAAAELVEVRSQFDRASR